MEMAPAMVAVMVMVSVSWIPDMGELMRQHAADLFPAEHIEKTDAHRDGRVGRIASGGEGIRLRMSMTCTRGIGTPVR